MVEAYHLLVVLAEGIDDSAQGGDEGVDGGSGCFGLGDHICGLCFGLWYVLGLGLALLFFLCFLDELFLKAEFSSELGTFSIDAMIDAIGDLIFPFGIDISAVEHVVVIIVVVVVGGLFFEDQLVECP